jgi:hypothetical protein
LESEFGKELKQECVMALKRLTEELDFRLNHKINKSNKISVKSPFARMTDYTFAADGLKQTELIGYQCFSRYILRHQRVNEINIVISSVTQLVDKHFVNEN